MDKFVQRLPRDISKDVAEEFLRRRPLKRERTWLTWSDAKKQKVARQFKENGFKSLKVCYGDDCPPANTVRGWSRNGDGPLRKPGRPTLLTPEEEQTVLDSFRKVRELGANVDHEGLLLLARSTTSKTRATALHVSKTWVTSFARRNKVVSLRITSSRPPSTHAQVQEDNRWRRLYEDIVNHPEAYNLPLGPIHPELQLALDETPAMYGASSPKTLAVQHNGSGESNQVRVKAGDKRCCTATIVVNRAGQVPVVQIIWRGQTNRCHARVAPPGL